MQMCESEQAHRIASERLALRAEVCIEAGSRIFGVLVVVVCLACAVYAIRVNADWKVVAALLGVPVMGFLGQLLGSRRQSSEERR